MTNYKILSPDEEELITQFTDMILTVSMKDCDVADIVREVNTHHRTRDVWKCHTNPCLYFMLHAFYIQTELYSLGTFHKNKTLFLVMERKIRDSSQNSFARF